MLIDNNLQYNFEESLVRIDQMLNLQIVEEEASAQVPILSELPTKGGVITNCSVMHIEIKSTSSESSGANLRVLRDFLSEAVAILSSQIHCVDIIVLGTRLTGVFSTPFKNNIEALIDKAAMINSLAQVISRKAKGMGLPSLTVKIGIDYGEAMLMRFGMYSVSEAMPSALAWMGRPVNIASKLIDTTNDNWNIWISWVVYRNLSDTYTKFFHHEEKSGAYGADVINMTMKNWLNKQ
jgi:hypothetical protein